MSRQAVVFLATPVILSAALGLVGCLDPDLEQRKAALADCAEMVKEGFRPIAEDRAHRFLGKVQKNTANCRGGQKAVEFRDTPWLDWANYWAAGDGASRASDRLTRLEEKIGSKHLNPNGRGVDGALLDLEYQRIELVKFNLFDNSGTYPDFVTGRDGVAGPALKTWDAMRLPPDHPRYSDVGGEREQLCRGDLIRFRNVTGICNDIKNPRMGSTGTPFARNVDFANAFPDLTDDQLVRNRHGDRLALLKPDPQVISRRLLTRAQSQPDRCNAGHGLEDWSTEAHCDYHEAPFFNVLAAFWIQFMNHDWFSHLDEGTNSSRMMTMGCKNKLVDGREVALTPEEAAELGCRPDDLMEASLYAAEDPAPTFEDEGETRQARAQKTTANLVTGWWDASQIYGYDEASAQRVKRDPEDPAKLLMVQVAEREGEGQGYLPLLEDGDPMIPAWSGQAATGFPDNWTVGLAFFHNVFAREHNVFVDAFRRQAAATPEADSGLRHPERAGESIAFEDVTDEELFQVARLVIAAEIAKIHTIEWTTQLLYNEPLYRAMNANWSGLFEDDNPVSRAMEKIVVNNFGKSEDAVQATQWYSVFASGSGIFGTGSRVYRDDAIFAKYDPEKTDIWNLEDPDHVNGGVNHFGSPFNFPEEFVTVYRLHPLLPDLIEYREWQDPDAIRQKIPVVETFRGKATAVMRERGLANFALSMGRQRLGRLTLLNHPQFLQNLRMERLDTPTKTIDVVALDILRDRERGVPRFNEFRRQYGLRRLTSFDDFVDVRLAEDSPERQEQERIVGILREVYGQHRCDASKIITDSQVNPDGSPIDDCLGHPDGSMVDNVEDVDAVVGWLAEFRRPHGYAISETQFQVFILNASRRLFSDRFFTSSFRPEFYTHFGVAWVNDNGPDGKVMEPEPQNGHQVEVSPLKRVLQRTLPELRPELEPVISAFDPWARDRGDYYSLEWKPRPGAEGDVAFSDGDDVAFGGE